MGGKWWPEAESNRRHKDFQSSALPTELSGQKGRREKGRFGGLSQWVFLGKVERRGRFGKQGGSRKPECCGWKARFPLTPRGKGNTKPAKEIFPDKTSGRAGSHPQLKEPIQGKRHLCQWVLSDPNGIFFSASAVISVTKNRAKARHRGGKLGERKTRAGRRAGFFGANDAKKTPRQPREFPWR